MCSYISSFRYFIVQAITSIVSIFWKIILGIIYCSYGFARYLFCSPFYTEYWFKEYLVVLLISIGIAYILNWISAFFREKIMAWNGRHHILNMSTRRGRGEREGLF